MPKLSTLSQAKLNTCHSDLILLINEVAKTEKCAVICGHRGKAEQEKAYYCTLFRFCYFNYK